MRARNFQVVVACYICISLLGCTSAAWRQADSYANREPKYWTIEDVTFAAIRDHRFVRLCVKLQNNTEEAVTEVNIDLQQVNDQLKNVDTAVSNIEEGKKLEKFHKTNEPDINIDDESNNLSLQVEEESYTPCITVLQKNEESLPVIVKKSDGIDISTTLFEIGEEPPDHPALFLIEHGEAHYIVFGAPMQMYSELTDHALRCYAEDQTEPSRYLLVPLAFVGDVAFVLAAVARVVVCILLLPLCIYDIASNDGNPNPSASEVLFPLALPPDTFKPECN